MEPVNRVVAGNKLYSVWNEFNYRLGGFGKVVIAGGAVRDYYLDVEPKDYDVFVLGNTSRDPLARACRDLTLYHSDRLPQLIESRSPQLVDTYYWHDMVTQVVWAPETTVDDLMRNFDWNVCRYSFEDGRFYNQDYITDITMRLPLRCTGTNTPLASLRRGFRFSERYNMPLSAEEVTRLCRALLSQS